MSLLISAYACVHEEAGNQPTTPLTGTTFKSWSLVSGRNVSKSRIHALFPIPFTLPLFPRLICGPAFTVGVESPKRGFQAQSAHLSASVPTADSAFPCSRGRASTTSCCVLCLPPCPCPGVHPSTSPLSHSHSSPTGGEHSAPLPSSGTKLLQPCISCLSVPRSLLL